MVTRHSVGGPARQLEPVLVLHSLVEDPSGLERGLRLLAMARFGPEACLAWGCDSEDRWIALCVTSSEVGSREIEAWLASDLRRHHAGGRLLLLAPSFREEPVLDGWTVEPWLWGRENAADVETVWIERLEKHGDDAFTLDLSGVRLTAEEIDSLVGPRPAAGAGT